MLGPEQPDQRAQLLSSLAFKHVLLGGGVRGRSVLGERLRGPPPLDVAHRVPGDLEQPAGETALPAKAPSCSSAVVNTRLVTSSQVAASATRNRAYPSTRSK